MELTLKFHRFPEEKPEKSGNYLVANIFGTIDNIISTDNYDADRKEFGTTFEDGTWVSFSNERDTEIYKDVLWCEIPETFLRLRYGDLDKEPEEEPRPAYHCWSCGTDFDEPDFVHQKEYHSEVEASEDMCWAICPECGSQDVEEV